jgi:hypothetical protein
MAYANCSGEIIDCESNILPMQPGDGALVCVS